MPIPKISAGDIVQVTVQSQAIGQVLLNVLHYRALIADTTHEYFEVMSELGAAVGDPAADGIVARQLLMMGANTTVDRVLCQRIAPLRSPYLAFEVGAPGQHPDDCDAQNVAAVISKVPDVAGRGKTGSYHLGGLANTVYGHGFITNAGRSLLAAVADRLNDPLLARAGGFLFEPVVFNPGSGSVGSANLIVSTPIKTTLRVMRRRTVGLGI